MPIFRRIGIQGFRRLKNIDLAMRPLMVLIGANGVGKTSFMDALSFLEASAKGSLNSHINEMGGFHSISTRGVTEEFGLKAEIDYQKEEPLKYQLQLAARFPGYRVSQEFLNQERGGVFQYIHSQGGVVQHCDANGRLVKAEMTYNDQESALYQVPRAFVQMDTIWRSLSSASRYHVLDVSRQAPVKLPQQLRLCWHPGTNGEDMAPFLYNLRESHRDRFEAIEDSLKAAFPSFEALGFPTVATGMIALTWKEKQFRNPFYVSELSEGTLRFLWLASLLQSPNLSTITMIDEPEVSMHPELLAVLVELMRESSLRSQIVVATHSDRLVRFLEPREVVAMDMNDDGAATMTWGDTLDLDEWLTEYSLDEVWQMGMMGGRA